MTKRKNIACTMRRAPGKISDSAPNGVVWRDMQSDRICIAWYQQKGHGGDHIAGLTTRDARLLQKRLKQFLDFGG
jgi:hypothetical protein